MRVRVEAIGRRSIRCWLSIEELEGGGVIEIR